MKQFFQKVPPIFKNFYFLSSLFFLVWMLFFDSNDLISQIKLSNKQQELENAKEFYESKILEVKNDREALLSNDELLEKLAREKYLMKKESEDIYIIEEE
ncbi:MAG: septum formation initiator [Flammeovirgaceae bacterium]|nr:septum formation initiator [Flammeovirgaceae bacterium]MBR10216.1 septum formation initiator [Rickettsiales bacterium]HCX23416.1 septum formation initiator [Cytophagales bacterium]|tara:strand:+ start:380 stop:679 length:300 start_codon:yes stop_codon:yes gene_type:complete